MSNPNLNGSRDGLAKSSRKDIWTLVKEAKEREKKGGGSSADEGVETTLIVVGSKQTGKTTLIHRLRNKDDPPGPTVGLEYRYARSTRGTIKDICHIWELAGGTFLADLMEIPITEANVHMSSFVVVADLSKPSESIREVELFIQKIQARVKLLLDGLEQRGSKRPKALRAFSNKKYGPDHPDASYDDLKVCPVPIIIIGSKLDAFRDVEPEKRKLICKMLRVIAHLNGASLLFANLKDETSTNKARKMLNHYAFRANALQEHTTDHNKPIVVVAGQDTMSQIGMPPSEITKETVGKKGVARYEQWRSDFMKYFPQVDEQQQKTSIDPFKFPEPTIDAMRAQKDEEFKRYSEGRNNSKDIPIGLTSTVTLNTNNKVYSRSRAAQMAL